MQLYLTRKSIPELADLPPQEARRIWRHCYLRMQADKTVALGMAALMACVLGCNLLGHALGSGRGLLVLLSAIGGGVGGFVWGQLVTRKLRPALAAERRVHKLLHGAREP